jgi:hypothetical protein
MAAGRSLGAVTDAYAIIEGVDVAPLVGALSHLSPISDAYPALLHDGHAFPVAADLVLLRAMAYADAVLRGLVRASRYAAKNDLHLNAVFDAHISTYNLELLDTYEVDHKHGRL